MAARASSATSIGRRRRGAPSDILTPAAWNVIPNGGFGPDYKYLTHRLGHGIGLDGHEWTYLVRGNTTKLRAGMCFTDEPGIDTYGELGINDLTCSSHVNMLYACRR